MLEFNTITPIHCKVGYQFDPKDQPSWDCIAPCIIIGVTDGGVPVLQELGGPKVNDQACLIPVGTLRTRGRIGMVRAEVLALGQYRHIPLDRIASRLVEKVYDTDSAVIFMLVNHDYIKLVGEIDCYQDAEIGREDLTMSDLIAMDLLSPEIHSEYKAQQDAAMKAQFGVLGEEHLQDAIRRLGLDRVQVKVDQQVALSRSKIAKP